MVKFLPEIIYVGHLNRIDLDSNFSAACNNTKIIQQNSLTNKQEKIIICDC